MEESIYGSNVITGSKEDLEQDLANRGVVIQTDNSENIVVKKEEDVEDETPKDEETQDEDVDKVITDEIQEQLKASKEAENVLTSKGVDYEALTKEYEETGGFSEKTYQALEKAGFNKQLVDSYVKGMEAVAEKFTNTVYDYVGGREAYEEMTKYIVSQGAKQVDSFNRLVSTGDMEQIKMAIDGINAKMASNKQAKHGTKNPSILGGGGSTVSNEGFATKAEMIDAMSDKRYGRDKSYTLGIQAKMVKTKFIG